LSAPSGDRGMVGKQYTLTGVLWRVIPLAGCFVLLLSCSDPVAVTEDPTSEDPCTEDPLSGDSVTVGDVAGSYAASTFTITEGGEVDDLLSEGGRLDLALDLSGAANGHMFVVGADEDGSDFAVDLTGIWMLEDSQATFDFAQDTFLDDVVFTFAEGRLTSEATFGAETICVVLTRSS